MVKAKGYYKLKLIQNRCLPFVLVSLFYLTCCLSLSIFNIVFVAAKICLSSVRKHDSDESNVCLFSTFHPSTHHFFSSDTANRTRICAPSLSLEAAWFCYKYDGRRLTHKHFPASVARWHFDNIRLEVSSVSALADPHVSVA